MSRDAALIPYIWLSCKDDLSHPVNLSLHAHRSLGEHNKLGRAVVASREVAERRACGIVGSLIGVPLRTAQDVTECYGELSAAAREYRAQLRPAGAA
jgi:hypothetical protein